MVPEQHWEGVPVTATLGRAGVDPAARFLKVYSGNFAVLLPLQEVLHGGAILIRTLNGAPLTPEHGAR
jgi:DMSO/TMAO reductase YedYZ molybdopterin-dependent catalytic subunit